MSTSTFFVLLWLFTNTSCFSWTHPLSISQSRVSVTHYTRVPEIVRRDFYHYFRQSSWLNNTKIIPGTVPYSHYNLEVDHRSPGNFRITTPTITFPIELGEIEISDRIKTRPRPSFEPTPVPTNVGSQMKHTSAIAFPEEVNDSFPKYGQNTTNRNYIVNPTIQTKPRPTLSTSLEESAIIFPEEEFSLQTQRPTIVVDSVESSSTSSSSSTQVPKGNIVETTTSFEYDDNKLAAEFLDWIEGLTSAMSSKHLNNTNSRENTEAVQHLGADFALLTSSSISKKCKPGYRLDQDGNCRKPFGRRQIHSRS